MSFRSQCLSAAMFGAALVATPMSAQNSAQQTTEIDNVAAFARLYGVARWFYPSDAAAALDWSRFAVDGIRRVRPARTPAELERTLKELFMPLGPGIEIGTQLSAKRATGARNPDLIAWHYRGAGIAEGAAGPYSTKRINRAVSSPSSPQSTYAVASKRPSDSLETPIAGAAADFALARGLQARVPLSLTDAEARTESMTLAGLRTALSMVPASAGRDDADVRLADAAVAWNLFRHFYPYWGDIDVDWDARLRPQLEIALNSAQTRDAHLDVVRSVVADLNDGHGNAIDVARPPRLALLPVQFRILAERLVVTASSIAAVPVGSVVTTFDGSPASTRILKEARLASGTPQWKRYRAESALHLCQLDATVTLAIEPPSGATREVKLPCTRSTLRVTESRPDSISELQPGIWYVDLTRVRAEQLRPMLDTVAKARGVVFDMRGYPTDAGFAVLPYLMRTQENWNDRWMHVPRYARPFAEVAEWQDISWNLRPATPHISGQRIFLTDGRAISYAESVMGYVRDYKLGTIIGGTTAGANGNIARFSIPGGFSLVFTGMRVTRHDGKTPFHTSGVSADIPLEPTLEGIRAGRDELLARALAALRMQP